MTARLRVAQLCADRGIVPGSTKGAAQHLRGIANGLIARGNAVTTYAQRRCRSSFPAEVRPISDFDRASAAGFDVIYERYSLGHRAGLDLARSVGRPFVLEVNAPLVSEASAHRPDTVTHDDAAVEAHLLAEADLVITVSTALSRWASSFRSGPVVTLANGFEPDWFTGPRPSAEYDLVFIGHPKPWHGADRLPQLVQDLGLAGIAATLLVIGGGPGADEMLKTATRLGVDRQITVTGSLPPAEATALLSAGTIGVAPYPVIDGFYFCPLKIVDYLAAGLPIVATDQGDIAQLVGDAGFVVPADDDRALAAAVRRLITDEPLRRQFGRRGRQRALDAHTWDHVAARTHAALMRVCRSSVVEPVAI